MRTNRFCALHRPALYPTPPHLCPVLPMPQRGSSLTYRAPPSIFPKHGLGCNHPQPLATHTLGSLCLGAPAALAAPPPARALCWRLMDTTLPLLPRRRFVGTLVLRAPGLVCNGIVLTRGASLPLRGLGYSWTTAAVLLRCAQVTGCDAPRTPRICTDRYTTATHVRAALPGSPFGLYAHAHHLQRTRTTIYTTSFRLHLARAKLALNTRTPLPLHYLLRLQHGVP